jgi:anhydro-N-acetylmuramic acid kinase
MMRVLGLMSGTSADGIDVALARISGAPPRLQTKLENFAAIPFRAHVREAVLRLAEGAPTTTAEISQLNFLLGEEFARAALAACRKFRVPIKKINLIGSHGQTVYHQGQPTKFLGVARVASTLQIGEPAVIAARTGVTTIGDFRVADMAAGGQGAPLVPFVDYLLYRHPRKGRVALNIGGIANVTVIPADAKPQQVFAFDTGPGNMVIDALVRHFTRGRQSFDRDARLARRGHVLPPLVNELMRDPYFRREPPKTCGREQYGAAYVARILARGRKLRRVSAGTTRRARPEDLIHSATLVTALSIWDAFHRFIFPRVYVHDLIVSGGGAQNPLLMAQLQALLPGVQIVTSNAVGVPTDAKEAFAFAIMAYESFHHRPANLPSATGARRPAILGKTCYSPSR